MKNIHKIILDGYLAKSAQSPLNLGTAGSHGVEQLQVALGDGWQGLTVQVIFHPCAVAVLLPESGQLDVPWEATEKPLTMMRGRIVFQGFDGEKLVNSTDLVYQVVSHSPTVGRDEQPYTPGIVEGVLNQMAADKDAILQAAQQTGQAKEAAAASAAEAASSAANAQQSAGAANTSAGQAAASAIQAAGSAAAANETLTQVQTAGQEAQQKVKDAETEALGNISAAAPALPAVSAAAAWQSATVKPDGTGYNLASMAPIEATIRPTVTGNPAVCKDSAAWAFQGLKIYGKSTQAGTPSPENPVPIISAGDGGNISFPIEGTNLLNYTDGKYTHNGITFYRRNGAITLYGTATAEAYISINLGLSSGKYFVSAETSGRSDVLFRVAYKLSQDGSYQYLNAPGKLELKTAPYSAILQVYVLGGKTVNNVTIKPMLNRGSTALPWQPYKEPQSLTISTPNGLPGIHVESGGNFTDADGQQLVCDEIDAENAKFTSNTLLKRVSPDFNWEYSSATNRFFFKDSDYLASASGSNADIYCGEYFCTHFANTVDGDYSKDLVVSYINNTSRGFAFRYLALNGDIEAWKQFLQENEVYVLGIRSSPVQTDIPAEELAAYQAMTTYDGTTVVSTAEPVAGIEARYVMDGNKYRESVDKRLAALEAAQTGI